MAKQSSGPESDQHDPKIFRESLGTFGTTTVPGQNQLKELATKVRQGVKHVELHLMAEGKGQFNTQDVPDKYGFEQRRTIMQLAKLNEQTLSVHGTFNVNSFSGLGQRGFDEVQRSNMIKEIDETVKFAAEAAKGGAVVFHLHETAFRTPPGELNLPDWYLKKLEKENKKEYDMIMKNYLSKGDLDRMFVDNPDLEKELKLKYESLNQKDKKMFKKNFNVNNWKDYYEYNKIEQIKLEQDGTPLVVVGDSITRASRAQEVISLDGLNNLNEKEKKFLKNHGITSDPNNVNIDDFQRVQATFTNGVPTQLDGLSLDEFKKLKSKFVTEYQDVLKDNFRMKSKADKEFFQKSMDMQIELARLQKEDLERNKKRYSQYMDEIEEIKQNERRLLKELDEATNKGDKKKEKEIINKLNGGDSLTDIEKAELNSIIQKARQAGGLEQADVARYQQLQSKVEPGLKNRKRELEVQDIGQIEYQKLERYDEMMAQLNEKIKKASEQKQNAKVLTDEIFEKNASAMAHLGLKALKYQLDLKEGSKDAKEKLAKSTKEIRELEEKYNKTTNPEEKSKLNSQIVKKKYDQRLIVGLSDYKDIDIEKRPLYLAPENIMAGYGYMDSLEEYKAVIKTSQEEFANKLLSGEKEYKEIKDRWEKQTGKKIETKEQAIKIAKNHIAGTFDNAHAGVWLKYFKREEGESDEHRLERFNKWLNQQAEDMYRQGIIKHFHFNDTQAKDDDHNLLGSGVLDIHDLRERLRKAGMREALIVEAGGRGGGEIMHILNAFEIFNPTLRRDPALDAVYGFNANKDFQGSTVSDWISAKRDYEKRPQYTQYGLGYSTFKHQQPQQGRERGGWSGTSFF